MVADSSARAQSRMPTFSSSKLNNRIVKKLIILFLLGVVLGPLGQAQTPIRVASYNIENYILSPIQNRPLKTKLAQAKVVESILAAKPDVLALQEVGTTKALAKLQKDLKAKGLNLPYVEHLKSFDPAIHVSDHRPVGISVHAKDR